MQPPTGTVVESPSVGLFWRAPSPGAPPFVEVGATVSDGDTLGIVEVMKLMNHVKAGVDGTVRGVHADNGSMIEARALCAATLLQNRENDDGGADFAFYPL